MPVALALYQPDIPQNTGTLMRFAACMGVTLHLIHPAGFIFSHGKLRRAGMDYLDHVDLVEHDSFEAFERWRRTTGRRLALMTTKASASLYDSIFRPDDVIMLGRESAGVPDSVAERADLRIRIPMRAQMRSLNVAVSGAMALGEALRQTGTLPG